MNRSTLAWLSVAALIVIGLAVWVGRGRSSGNAEQALLYPDLKGKLAEVSAISIFKAGDQLAVELTRDGATWRLKQKFDHPADTGKVNSLLINLEDAKLREQKTANPENYSALSVQDLSDTATTGVRVELSGVKTPVKLIVGKRDGGTRSTYVRRANEAQSWLIGSELDVPPDPTAWLKREILDIAADRIMEAQIAVNAAPAYTLFKSARADANFDIKGLPKGRELNSVAAPNAIAQSLVSLQLEDVRPASDIANDKAAARTQFRTFDGLVIEAMGYKIGDRHWATFKASFDAELAKRFHQSAERTSETSDKAGDAKKADGAEKSTQSVADSLDAMLKKGSDEAGAVHSALANWAYALPSYKYDAIFKPLEELLKKK